MNSIGTQAPYAGQPAAQPAGCGSDSQFLMGLGVVLLCFGQAITGSHTVSIVGLAIIVLSGWLD